MENHMPEPLEATNSPIKRPKPGNMSINIAIFKRRHLKAKNVDETPSRQPTISHNKDLLSNIGQPFWIRSLTWVALIHTVAFWFSNSLLPRLFVRAWLHKSPEGVGCKLLTSSSHTSIAFELSKQFKLIFVKWFTKILGGEANPRGKPLRWCFKWMEKS